MISALLSFLGGSVFRMIWGELSSWLTAKQNHKQELELLTKQEEIAAATFLRQQEAIKTQHAQGIEVVHVQAEVDLAKIDAGIFEKGVELTGKTTGIRWVDAWNGIIRPMLATECMLLWSLHLHRHDWTLDENGWALVGAALGIFVADRTLMKRGK